MGNTNIIPDAINSKIVSKARAIADEMGYLNAAISDRTRIINNLSAHSEVGKELEKFLPKDKVRSHIKDNILRAYSQEQFVPYGEQEHKHWGEKKFGYKNLILVSQEKGSPRRSVYWFKDDETNESLIISESAYKCWESALRLALLFLAKNKVSKCSSDVKIALSLSPGTSVISNSEEKFLSETLAYINVYLQVVRR